MSSKEMQLQAARKLFAELRLPGWRESNQRLRPGGQAGVLTVEKASGEKGVFRCLTQTNPKSVERFSREIRILTDARFRHPHVVEIIASTTDSDHQWYISRLGHSFKSRWERFQDEKAGDPVTVLVAAVQVVTQLADGLTALHDSGVVHRDIKPDNVILDAPTGQIVPRLIDFGIAHVEYEDRLTDADSAVGNKRYSPDVMMNRMDEVPPWLDVFQLSQLLIWMVQTPPAIRHWDRPLDWRFVNYADRLPDDLVVAVRAVTALCSEERISPRNGRELASLLRERFPASFTADRNPPMIDVSKIHQGIAKGKSTQDFVVAQDLRMIDASAAGAAVVYRELHEGLEALTASLQAHNILVQKGSDARLEVFVRTLTGSASGRNEATLYQLDLGEPAGKQFHFRVNCVAFIPSLRPYMNAPSLPESSNMICFYLQRYASLTRVQFPSITMIVTIERDGTLRLRSERMEIVEQTDVQRLLDMIKSWIEDPAPWEMIQRDR
jgi:serine/threonine protein kinase